MFITTTANQGKKMSNLQYAAYAETIWENLITVINENYAIRRELSNKLNVKEYNAITGKYDYKAYERALEKVAIEIEEICPELGAPSCEQIEELLIHMYELEV